MRVKAVLWVGWVVPVAVLMAALSSWAGRCVAAAIHGGVTEVSESGRVFVIKEDSMVLIGLDAAGKESASEVDTRVPSQKKIAVTPDGKTAVVGRGEPDHCRPVQPGGRGPGILGGEAFDRGAGDLAGRQGRRRGGALGESGTPPRRRQRQGDSRPPRRRQGGHRGAAVF